MNLHIDHEWSIKRAAASKKAEHHAACGSAKFRWRAIEAPNLWLKSLLDKMIALHCISLSFECLWCGVVWSDMQTSIVAAADCRGRGIMLAACGGGNSVRMKRKLKPTPLQTAPNPDSTSAWLAYPGISNSFCIKTQPQERALVLDRHWRETDRCFHLRRIE